MPGAPDKCRCDFVTSANAEHCLQSINTPDIAQTEGFAQYFASRTYNRDDSATCVFRYYKEFLGDGCRLGVDPGSCVRPARTAASSIIRPCPWIVATPFAGETTSALAPKRRHFPRWALSTIGWAFTWPGPRRPSIAPLRTT